jgi:hypothetical protein
MKNNIEPHLKKIIKNQEKQIDLDKQQVEVTKVSRNILQKIFKGTMKLWEQRTWYVIAIIATLIAGFFAGGIYFKLKANNLALEYDVSVSVSPDDALMNYNQDIPFTFTFTNTGKKNITEFYVSKLDLYREEKGIPVLHRQLVFDFQPQVVCESHDGHYNPILPVGKKCTLTAKMSSCPECFDDKD